MNIVGIVVAMRIEARCLTNRHLPIGEIINLGNNSNINNSNYRNYDLDYNPTKEDIKSFISILKLLN